MRKAYSMRGISASLADIMIASITQSTLKQYEVAFRSWWKYCQNNNKNPFEVDILLILDFLEAEFNRGVAYGSLNNIRSALAMVLSPGIGTDYRIKRFIKGVAKLKPSLPRYKSIWDPTIVLKHLQSLFPNESLSLELLTKKLITLFALITAHRAQTFALIDIRNIHQTKSGYDILITDRIKTSGINKQQPCLAIPYFENDNSICAATTLESYLKATSQFRETKFRLFLTYKKPIKEASSQSISRWIKATLSESGIDTSIFCAHSTRHAATSKAKRDGVSLDVIRKTAGWSVASEVFAKFYNKPLLDNRNMFAMKIYQSGEVVSSFTNCNLSNKD
nr:unnamed protein product [Callosobruchus analis]